MKSQQDLKLSEATQKRWPDMLARVVLTAVMLSSIWYAAQRYATGATDSLLFFLGNVCFMSALLASPKGKILPHRNARMKDLYRHATGTPGGLMSPLQHVAFLVGLACWTIAVFVD